MSPARPKASGAEGEALAQRIRGSVSSSKVIDAKLKTDDRVIARVTDGIYRQPGSAIRELISNAYDADATKVVIRTDRPRFEKITIEDDGIGMAPEAVANLIEHIGGSAKRSPLGKQIGVTSQDNLFLSPSGRRLIGKIGIGLFSVSQLTNTFQIVTKVKGDNFRTIASIVLKQYSDDAEFADGKPDYESGKAKIWTEKATDLEAHGTTIILTGIRPQTQATLQSKEVWSAIARSKTLQDEDETADLEPPKFHIGHLDEKTNSYDERLNSFPCLPWLEKSSPVEAFREFVDSIWRELDNGNTNPQLEKLFDHYLVMIWQLSLAVPIEYIDRHLFDEPNSDWCYAYRASNELGGKATEIKAKRGETFRKVIGLTDESQLSDNFRVLIDELELRRPIKFRNLPVTSHALTKPVVLFGKCKELFTGIPKELSSGPLSFDAYLFWNPKIVPTEHTGVLVRIHGASGTLFDQGFMRYQVSEQTRLRQITCEIFVQDGLDSSLNIDRESFNNAHPHAVYITRWLHQALRQLATIQKRLSAEIRETRRVLQLAQVNSDIQTIVQKTWEDEGAADAVSAPAVRFVDDNLTKSDPGDFVFTKASIFTQDEDSEKKRTSPFNAIHEEKVRAIFQVLASFGLLERLTKKRQEKLLRAISRIISIET
jgi:hypothetical protein